MADIAISNPLPQFFDLNGTPLDGGYLYFGEPNQNPITSPKSVKWSVSPFVPAAQPIRTTNGFPTRQGTPALVYIDGDYSILVQDKFRRTVVYAKNSSEFDNAQALTQELIADLAEAGGSAMVGYQLNKANSALQTIKSKLDRMPFIEDMILAGDIDITAAFARAMAHGGAWQCGPGPFTINPLNTIQWASGFIVQFNGTVFNHASTTVPTIECTNTNDIGILGSLTINGAGEGPGTAYGVKRTGGNRGIVENVVCKAIRGWGFYETFGTMVQPRGDQWNWINCRAYDCYTGREDIPESSTEYNVWVNFTASGCVYPNVTAAGNNMFIGGNIVDNDNGPWLKGGENHLHGVFLGVHINHNGALPGGWNIRCTDVDNGEVFVGCTIYGDSPGTGIIWLERSKGILYTAGILDASVFSDDATGYNFFTNNFTPDSVNTVGKYGTANKKIMLRDNYARTGMWKYNDPGSAFVRASRAGALAIPAATATTLIFNTEAYDTRDMLNTTTGIAALPWLGNFKIYGSVFITAASGMTSGFLTLFVGGTPAAYAPVVAVNGTQAFGSFSWSIGGSTGATIELKISMPAGTTMNLDSTSQLNIEEIT